MRSANPRARPNSRGLASTIHADRPFAPHHRHRPTLRTSPAPLAGFSGATADSAARVEPVEAADDAAKYRAGCVGVEDELLGGPLSGRQRIQRLRAAPRGVPLATTSNSAGTTIVRTAVA